MKKSVTIRGVSRRRKLKKDRRYNDQKKSTNNYVHNTTMKTTE